MAKIPVIKTVNLNKTFDLGKVKVKALTNINVEIYSGEFVIFFGPSGCGKSTLMSIVAGLQPPTSGDILIRDENLAKLNKTQLAKHRRSKIGIVFQTYNLIGTMNVLENIALPLTFGAIGKRRRMKRAENLLETVGLSECRFQTPSELSGGQQQRVAIARALVCNPWIMLADEPTGNLDSKSSNEVLRLLISLNRKSKRTVVLITHNPEYLQYAERVFCMLDGKIVKVKVNPNVIKKSSQNTKKKKNDKSEKSETLKSELEDKKLENKPEDKIEEPKETEEITTTE